MIFAAILLPREVRHVSSNSFVHCNRVRSSRVACGEVAAPALPLLQEPKTNISPRIAGRGDVRPARRDMMKRDLTGGYFPCCQFCKHDGSCELKHYEFMGVPPGGGIDRSPFHHENLSWGFSLFQRNTSRAQCTGRIRATDRLFFPIACECGTVVDSFCQKFVPNEKGEERMALARQIAAQKEVALSEITTEDLPTPPPYNSVMR